jgi:hypothetical protein
MKIYRDNIKSMLHIALMQTKSIQAGERTQFKPSMVHLFEEADGFHFCDRGLGFLDARGRGFKSRHAALRAARESFEFRINTELATA